MSAAAALYVGRTTHARLSPFQHRFSYRIASLLIDVDRLEEAGDQARFFSVDRFNVFAFHRRDHGERENAPLRPWAERAFASAGVTLDGGAVKLLCFPRLLGYVFNPVSLWFGYGPDGGLRGVIYEVNNTFGDTHSYVAPVGETISRHSAVKRLFVSPFFTADGLYHFRLRAPDEGYGLAIRYERSDGTALIATHAGRRAALTDQALARVIRRTPALTHKVISAIHWEAAKLWRKGARLQPRPTAPSPFSTAKPAAKNPPAHPNIAAE